MKPLSKDFFEKSTEEVAKNLLGCYLVHGETAGKIVETEAYLHDDPAAHSFNGKTKRNEAMFARAGTLYVYFTYGMYHCFNIVTNREGVGEAVLIRALEPISGLELMRKRRGVEDVKKLCNGPAKLVIALGLRREHNGLILGGKIKVLRGEKPKRIGVSERIGISRGKNEKLRFFVEDSEFVSEAKRKHI